MPDFEIETEIIDNFYLSPVMAHNNIPVIAGCDEAGRGPLCGPVVAGAVIIQNPDLILPDLIALKINDSKKMTPRTRAAAYDYITASPHIIWAAAQCSPAEIDDLNILHASMLAMKRAIEALSVKPDVVLVDGNRLPDNLIHAPLRSDKISSDYISQMNGNSIIGRALPKGDAKSMSIACASIIAKVTRDKIMRELSLQFPEYGWDKNAGYPTPSHLNAIKIHGINDHYRKSFKPVKDLL